MINTWLHRGWEVARSPPRPALVFTLFITCDWPVLHTHCSQLVGIMYCRHLLLSVIFVNCLCCRQVLQDRLHFEFNLRVVVVVSGTDVWFIMCVCALGCRLFCVRNNVDVRNMNYHLHYSYSNTDVGICEYEYETNQRIVLFKWETTHHPNLRDDIITTWLSCALQFGKVWTTACTRPGLKGALLQHQFEQKARPRKMDDLYEQR